MRARVRALDFLFLNCNDLCFARKALLNFDLY